TILMSRRFASAAAVRRDASHHQAATIRAKAPTSAALLNAPRPAARLMSKTCRFTIGQWLDRTFSSACRGSQTIVAHSRNQAATRPAPLVRQMVGAWCEPDQESRMVLKIERFQPEGMNVRMSGGKPSYSHLVTVSGSGKIVYT